MYENVTNKFTFIILVRIVILVGVTKFFTLDISKILFLS